MGSYLLTTFLTSVKSLEPCISVANLVSVSTILFFVSITHAKSEILWEVFFSLFLAWVQDSKEIHALCFILALIGIIVVFLTGQIGVSVLGVCGLKVAKSSIFIYFTLFIVYLFVLIVTSIIFLKYLRRISSLDGKARVFFKYFLVYTLLISAIYLIYSITLILLIVDCYTGLTENL